MQARRRPFRIINITMMVVLDQKCSCGHALARSCCFLVAGLLSLATVACDKSHLRVQVLQPAVVNIGPVRQLAVDEIIVTERSREITSPSRPRRPLTLGTIATDLLLAILGLNSGDEEALGNRKIYDYSDPLVARLIANGHYTVLAANSQDAEAYLTGAGAYRIREEGQWSDKKQKDREGHETTTRVYEITRQVSLELSLRITQPVTGRILATMTLEDDADDAESGSDENAARRGLDSVDDLVKKIMNGLLDEVVTRIAPHYILETVELDPNSSGRMKTAQEFARQLKWDEARTIWTLVLANPNSPDERRAAQFNLGVSHEVRGEFDEAESCYRECLAEQNTPRYRTALNRLIKRREAVALLREQGR